MPVPEWAAVLWRTWVCVPLVGWPARSLLSAAMPSAAVGSESRVLEFAAIQPTHRWPDSAVGWSSVRARLPDWLDGTGWRWSVSGGEVRRDRGTTAVGAGYPPRFGLRSSARIAALFTVEFCWKVVSESEMLATGRPEHHQRSQSDVIWSRVFGTTRLVSIRRVSDGAPAV